MPRMRKLFERYASAVAYVAVRSPTGAESIGTAFHVGEGVFLTARHVVEQREILQVRTTLGARPHVLSADSDEDPDRYRYMGSTRNYSQRAALPS